MRIVRLPNRRRAVLGTVAVTAVLASVLAVTSVGNAATYPNPGKVTGDITGVHDPSMIKAADGTYMLFSTDNWLEIRTSTDRINFKKAGSVWPNGASWTYPFTLSDNRKYLWAPDISFHNGKYYLYYAASSLGSRNSAIFLATSTTGKSGSWTNLGIVMQTSSANKYNAIDPNLIVDASGRWWLSFGSWGTGIKMIRIDSATGKQHAGDKTLYAIAQRTSGSQALEAPYIERHGSYYYLFTSWDHCCAGTKSDYKTKVGRSTTITGPYVDKSGKALTASGGTEVLATHGTIYGPGHPAVLHDTDGDLLIYHYYYSDATPLTGKLGINLMGYDSAGWPYVY
jgi:arabinan endo-1,5-alpha-L-arabinosidase